MKNKSVPRLLKILFINLKVALQKLKLIFSEVKSSWRQRNKILKISNVPDNKIEEPREMCEDKMYERLGIERGKQTEKALLAIEAKDSKIFLK